MPIKVIEEPALLNELVHVIVFDGNVLPTTDEEIAQAVPLDTWHDRHGKPYQAKIEADVAAYRGHIPNYVGSGEWLAEGIEKVTQGHTVFFRGDAVIVDYNYNEEEFIVKHDDILIAFWNAAIRACDNNDEKD